MSLRTQIIRLAAAYISRDINRWKKNAVSDQFKILHDLVKSGRKTVFGKDHHFDKIDTYDDFKKLVPVRDYEDLRPYIDRMTKGEKDILWPGRPRYFAKTSGTTSGVKYIPITDDSMPNHINTARNAMFNYFNQSGNFTVLNGKLIFLSGSPQLENKGGIPTGRLSGIVNHEIPAWAKKNQLPGYETNCIEDWEQKLDRIVSETLGQPMSLISGIPPWVQMYYERLLERTGKKTVREVFPGYSLFIYGGVNFEPYRGKLEELTGGPIDSIETYPASEGFIAFQDDKNDPGLLLNTRSGIFFEFIPADQAFEKDPPRLMLSQVELNRDYVVIINSNAGLWGYNIGDCVRFISLDPYRLLVTGRVKHFISAFGEHVIGKEVEEAMLYATEKTGAKIVEFTVAPQVLPPDGQAPYHEWFIEFDTMPSDVLKFCSLLDEKLREENIYYEDLRKGNILQNLKITSLQKDAFREYMSSQGKLGGQNKVPRLSNDRKIADDLSKYIF